MYLFIYLLTYLVVCLLTYLFIYFIIYQNLRTDACANRYLFYDTIRYSIFTCAQKLTRWSA